MTSRFTIHSGRYKKEKKILLRNDSKSRHVIEVRVAELGNPLTIGAFKAADKAACNAAARHAAPCGSSKQACAGTNVARGMHSQWTNVSSLHRQRKPFFIKGTCKRRRDLPHCQCVKKRQRHNKAKPKGTKKKEKQKAPKSGEQCLSLATECSQARNLGRHL